MSAPLFRVAVTLDGVVRPLSTPRWNGDDPRPRASAHLPTVGDPAFAKPLSYAAMQTATDLFAVLLEAAQALDDGWGRTTELLESAASHIFDSPPHYGLARRDAAAAAAEALRGYALRRGVAPAGDDLTAAAKAAVEAGFVDLGAVLPPPVVAADAGLGEDDIATAASTQQRAALF
ncbi:MAG: hypothetical protein AAF684_12310, partial [Pseudomonadota bacterium]